MRIIRSLTLTAAVAVLTGCAGGGGLGGLGDILGTIGGGGAGTPQQGTIQGEVEQVDTRNQLIHLRTSGGQRGAVRYDQQTQVVYRQQNHPVTALEPGDIVSVQAQQTQGGEVYAVRIDVQQSVQERTGQTTTPTGRQTFTGTVGRVEHQQGWFELRSQYTGAITVALPYNVDRATQDRFHRLQTGETVRLEGTQLNAQRVEIYRFY